MTTTGMRLRAFLERQWFLLALAVVLVIALTHPVWGSRGGPAHPERWAWASAPGIFLISGLVLPSAALRRAIAQGRLHVVVQSFSILGCGLLFSLLALGAWWWGAPPSLALGMVILGVLPTTIASGVAFTRAAGGDEAAALVSAAIGNLVGLIVAPAIMLLVGRAGGHTGPTTGQVLGSLTWQMLLPVAVGQLLQRPLGAWAATRRKLLSQVTSVLLLVLIWTGFSASVTAGAHLGARVIALSLVLGILAHGLALAGCAWLTAWPALRLDRASRTAALLCATQKSAAMGIPLLQLCFPQDPRLGLLTLPLLIYHPLQLVVASLLAPWLARWNQGAPSPAVAPRALSAGASRAG